MLFAWPFLPKLARAEGRDPRMLTIILRGALDGLAAVAPVGDPDWVKLRGDKALLLDGKTPALPLDSFFALNPAMPNLHRLYKAGAGRDRACGGDALSRALAFRRAGRAGKRAAQSRAAPTTGWLNRALGGLEAGSARAPRRPRFRGRPGDAAGGARTGAGDVMDADSASSRRAKTPWRG